MKTIILALIAMALVACGDLTVEQPQNQGEQGKGDESGTLGESHDEIPKADPAESTGSKEINRPKNNAARGAPAIYSPVEQDWLAAVDRTPAGYHLATRAEIVALIDAGALKDLGADKAELWSSTEDDDRIAYFVDGDSGQVGRMDKTMIMQTVYLRGEN